VVFIFIRRAYKSQFLCKFATEKAFDLKPCVACDICAIK